MLRADAARRAGSRLPFRTCAPRLRFSRRSRATVPRGAPLPHGKPEGLSRSSAAPCERAAPPQQALLAAGGAAAATCSRGRAPHPPRLPPPPPLRPPHPLPAPLPPAPLAAAAAAPPSARCPRPRGGAAASRSRGPFPGRPGRREPRPRRRGSSRGRRCPPGSSQRAPAAAAEQVSGGDGRGPAGTGSFPRGPPAAAALERGMGEDGAPRPGRRFASDVAEGVEMSGAPRWWSRSIAPRPRCCIAAACE